MQQTRHPYRNLD